MSAEQGWIGEPQLSKTWHESIASRRAKRIKDAAEEKMREAEAAAFEAWERRRSEVESQIPDGDS